MTPRRLIRPVLVCLTLAGLGACGAVDGEPNRFESLADAVAALPVDATPSHDEAPRRSPGAPGLTPADLRVEVLDPHALWDARDGLDHAVERGAPRIAAAAAPAVADAVVKQVSTGIGEIAARAAPGPSAAAAPAAPARTAAPSPPGGELVQLGAYSTEAAARAAWRALTAGEAAWALDGLSPVYEDVDVGGRRLTRLKVRAPAAGAAAVCAAARIDDPWCHRAS